MQGWKVQTIDKQKTSDSSVNSSRIDYPIYLDNVRQHLELSLLNYTVQIVEKQKQELSEHSNDFQAYSIILTSPKVFREKYQIFTEAFLNQKQYFFYVRHLVTHNHLQLIIQNRQSISMAINLCNKINQNMESFRLIIDSASGKIFFETKFFINQSSLHSLQKQIINQDFCFYTQIIYCSTKKSEKYIDLILFILGQLSLSELTTDIQLLKKFPFFKDCQKIIEKLENNIFYIPFLNKNSQIQSNEEKQDSSNYQDTSIHNLKFSDQKKIESKKEIDKQRQDTLSDIKVQILNNSLQYFSSNIQNTLKLFTPKNIYQNVDFSNYPLIFEQKNNIVDKTIIDIDKRSQFQSKKILSFIQVIHVEGSSTIEDQNMAWKKIHEGGFGIIQMATIRYKNIQNFYRESDETFSILIKQQMIRKREKIINKHKIQREKNILKKLQNFSHPNITNFYISLQTQYENCIFSDYTPHMSLDLYLKKNEYSVNFHHKLSFMAQAVEGLIFLHQKKIVHLDIKPGNMLINKKLLLLISDFGEAFVIGENDPITHNHAYTIPYCAPQIFKTKAQLTEKADIYAIGVCILKVILGEAFLNTFLQRKFVKRLCGKDLINLGIMQKFQKSFIYPIFKIIMMIAYQAVNEISERRPNLLWISEILTQCRNFLLTLLY